jgi:hypothetical protein
MDWRMQERFYHCTCKSQQCPQRGQIWTGGCRRGSTTVPVSLNSVHSEGRYGLVTGGCRKGSTTVPVSLNSVHSEGRYGLEDAGEVLDHAVQVSGQPPSLSLYILHQGRVHNLKNLFSSTPPLTIRNW